MKYRKRGGFGDDTDYIEIQEDGEGFIVMKSGRRKPMHWREVRRVEEFVEDGDWELIDG